MFNENTIFFFDVWFRWVLVVVVGCGSFDKVEWCKRFIFVNGEIHLQAAEGWRRCATFCNPYKLILWFFPWNEKQQRRKKTTNRFTWIDRSSNEIMNESIRCRIVWQQMWKIIIKPEFDFHWFRLDLFSPLNKYAARTISIETKNRRISRSLLAIGIYYNHTHTPAAIVLYQKPWHYIFSWTV